MSFNTFKLVQYSSQTVATLIDYTKNSYKCLFSILFAPNIGQACSVLMTEKKR